MAREEVTLPSYQNIDLDGDGIQDISETGVVGVATRLSHRIRNLEPIDVKKRQATSHYYP